MYGKPRPGCLGSMSAKQHGVNSSLLWHSYRGHSSMRMSSRATKGLSLVDMVSCKTRKCQKCNLSQECRKSCSAFSVFASRLKVRKTATERDLAKSCIHGSDSVGSARKQLKPYLCAFDHDGLSHEQLSSEPHGLDNVLLQPDIGLSEGHLGFGMQDMYRPEESQ